MLFEARLQADKAIELYLEILEQNPADSQTLKRVISIYRDNDLLPDAISLLNKYLEVNQQDQEAWLELTDIYLAKQNYAKAQFCYEELLTIQPHNYLINLRYAEILHSLGGLDNLYLARKYFSHCLVLKEDGKCLRALFGLLNTCKQIE